nr:copia protein [Tanacetum cinerariifolium]
METIHVKFDELTAMASEHDSLEPKIQRFNNINSSAETMNTTSKEDLDNLFGLMFEEYFGKKSFDTPINSATQPTQLHEDLPSTYSINIEKHEAPLIETTSDEQTSSIFLTEADELHQEDSADFDGNSHLKKVPRAWCDKLSSFLIEHGFTKDFSKRFENLMKNNFEMSMMGELKFFLGLQVHQSPRGIFISQSQYTIEFLKNHGLDECVSMSTPMATKRLDADLQGTPTDQTVYRRMIRGLMYLTASRPDIAYATFVYARYQACPTVKHLKEVKRIFWYLRQSYNKGPWSSKDFGFELIAYSDADHAGCKDDCKSTSGGLQFLGGKLVNWSLKKQDCTTMSTAEVEYVSLSACCAQVIWMCTQLLDYGYKYNRILMYCVSKSAIAISCNQVQHSKTKHINIRYHFIKEHVEKGTVELYFVSTEYQLADLFTKALPKERFEYLVHRIVIIMAHQQIVVHLHTDELCPPNKRYDLMDANKKIDQEHVQCLSESKILTNIIKNHPLRFSTAASPSVPWIYMAQIIFYLPQATNNNHDSFVLPPSFSDMIPFYKNHLGFTMELKTPSSFKTTEEMKQMEHYRMYAKVFGIDVPLTQSQLTGSTQGTHRTPSSPKLPTPKVDATESSVPTQSTMIRHHLPQQKSTRLTPPAPVLMVDKADELILQDALQMVEGQEHVVDDSSIPRNDEHNIPGTREKGKNVEESRIIPSPTPIRSPRIHTDLISSDTEKLQELTVPHTTPSSSSPSNKLSHTNQLLSLFKAKHARFKRYKTLFHELQGRYGYLFQYLKARFMLRKSFGTIANHLHDAMIESLPVMVDKHVKEQVEQQVPEQVCNQVPVYVAEGLILERKMTKEEMENMIAKAILQEHGNIQA